MEVASGWQPEADVKVNVPTIVAEGIDNTQVLPELSVYLLFAGGIWRLRVWALCATAGHASARTAKKLDVANFKIALSYMHQQRVNSKRRGPGSVFKMTLIVRPFAGRH
jgi:hypothetical protein